MTKIYLAENFLEADQIISELEANHIFAKKHEIIETSITARMAKPVFEKFAYDVTALKVNQSMHKAEMVPNNVIRGAIENMDTLYKMAYGIDNAIDKDNLSFK